VVSSGPKIFDLTDADITSGPSCARLCWIADLKPMSTDDYDSTPTTVAVNGRGV